MPPDKAEQPLEIGTALPPQETVELRRGLKLFLNQPLSNFIGNPPLTAQGRSISIGAVKWGAYAFYDYEGEPIYVGQTRESLGTRIRRHLTNQRTDAVAMAVLDPFEVRTIKVWPLLEYQNAKGSHALTNAAEHLNSVERAAFLELVNESRFGRMLNEKDPPTAPERPLPPPISGDIVPEEVIAVRLHPDTRIARRAQTIARLSAIIASRNVAGGLRRALATQADRLAYLAGQRYAALGGERLVDERDPDEDDE